jgi:hypothetical protein
VLTCAASGLVLCSLVEEGGLPDSCGVAVCFAGVHRLAMVLHFGLEVAGTCYFLCHLEELPGTNIIQGLSEWDLEQRVTTCC